MATVPIYSDFGAQENKNLSLWFDSIFSPRIQGMNLSHNFTEAKDSQASYLAWKSIQCKIKSKEVFFLSRYSFFLLVWIFFFFAGGAKRLCGFLKVD